MTRAEELYPSIIEDIRGNLGLEKEDPSMDDRIAAMPRDEILMRYLTWNGIIGYADRIRNAVSEIYQVDLLEPYESHETRWNTSQCFGHVSQSPERCFICKDKPGCKERYTELITRTLTRVG